MPGTKSYIHRNVIPPDLRQFVLLGTILVDRKRFVNVVLKPLQDKKETVYVLPNSHAKAHAERRYPHKRVKVVDGGIRGR